MQLLKTTEENNQPSITLFTDLGPVAPTSIKSLLTNDRLNIIGT